MNEKPYVFIEKCEHTSKIVFKKPKRCFWCGHGADIAVKMPKECKNCKSTSEIQHEHCILEALGAGSGGRR